MIISVRMTLNFTLARNLHAVNVIIEQTCHTISLAH